MIAFGFGELRLAPDAFWAMTPRELAAAAGAMRPAAIVPPDRRRLDQLMQRYPDKDTTDG